MTNKPTRAYVAMLGGEQCAFVEAPCGIYLELRSTAGTLEGMQQYLEGLGYIVVDKADAHKRVE